MHLHFDISGGASGDMLLAACLDLGLDFDEFTRRLSAMKLDGYRLEASRLVRGGISANHIEVTDTTASGHHHDHDHDHEHEHSHDHEHHHGHEHHQKPASDNSHSHSHDGPHRHLKDMLEVLDSSPFSEQVKTRAEGAIRSIAMAEAKVHGKTIDEIHFHEISGIDTLVDIVGVCLAVEMLGVTSVSCSSLPVGQGTFECAHGVMPLPAPATLEIMTARNIPFYQTGINAELVTPTGAALLATLADSFGPCPEMSGSRAGYGAGSRDNPERANLTRAVIGEKRGAAGSDSVIEYRFAVDDMTAEEIAYAAEKIFAAGALDVYTNAVNMKKGRPGTEITVISPIKLAAEIEQAIFRETSTFGFRKKLMERGVLCRNFATVTVGGQEIKIKQGYFGDELVRQQPEFEDCRKAAEVTGLPIAEIFRLAREAAKK